jgi:hypothetical protein
MSSQTKGLKRNTIDKFYTKREVAEKLVNHIKEKIKFGEKDLIIEPSAGEGSFIQPIKSLTKNFLFYDIEPEVKVEKF